MAIDHTYGFEAVEGELTLYNGQAVLDFVISHYLPATEDDYDLIIDNQYYNLYSFPGYQSSFLDIYDSEERNTLIKSLTTQVSRNSNNQVINASVSDMTFDENGTRYFVLGYVRSGYDIALRYGKLFII